MTHRIFTVLSAVLLFTLQSAAVLASPAGATEPAVFAGADALALRAAPGSHERVTGAMRLMEPYRVIEARCQGGAGPACAGGDSWLNVAGAEGVNGWVNAAFVVEWPHRHGIRVPNSSVDGLRAWCRSASGPLSGPCVTFTRSDVPLFLPVLDTRRMAVPGSTRKAQFFEVAAAVSLAAGAAPVAAGPPVPPPRTPVARVDAPGPRKRVQIVLIVEAGGTAVPSAVAAGVRDLAISAGARAGTDATFHVIVYGGRAGTGRCTSLARSGADFRDASSAAAFLTGQGECAPTPEPSRIWDALHLASLLPPATGSREVILVSSGNAAGVTLGSTPDEPPVPPGLPAADVLRQLKSSLGANASFTAITLSPGAAAEANHISRSGGFRSVAVAPLGAVTDVQRSVKQIVEERLTAAGASAGAAPPAPTPPRSEPSRAPAVPAEAMSAAATGTGYVPAVTVGPVVGPTSAGGAANVIGLARVWLRADPTLEQMVWAPVEHAVRVTSEADVLTRDAGTGGTGAAEGCDPMVLQAKALTLSLLLGAGASGREGVNSRLWRHWERTAQGGSSILAIPDADINGVGPDECAVVRERLATITSTIRNIRAADPSADRVLIPLEVLP